MSAQAAKEREEAHRLLELVPNEDVPTIRRVLAALAGAATAAREDPVRAAFENAPEDDEEVTEEDIAAWREGQADADAGRVVSTDELRRRLGL